jgi:hypothetical protein
MPPRENRRLPVPRRRPSLTKGANFGSGDRAASLNAAEQSPNLRRIQSTAVYALQSSAVRPQGAVMSLPYGAGTAMSALEGNLAQANKYLARFRADCVLNQIGGEALPAVDGATFETISPGI